MGSTLDNNGYEENGGELDVEEACFFRQGKPTAAPMVFAELDCDENNTDISSSKLKGRVASAGDIRIQLEKGQEIEVSLSDSDDDDLTLEGIGKIPENYLKGKFLSHQVKLQEYEPREEYGAVDFVPDEEGIIATFVFKYRSKSALQAEGIISRTLSPTLLEDRPIEELNLEEAHELLRRHKERDAIASAVKREFKAEDIGGDIKTDADHAESDLEVTTVRPVKQQRISGPNKAIDLTSD